MNRELEVSLYNQRLIESEKINKIADINNYDIIKSNIRSEVIFLAFL